MNKEVFFSFFGVYILVGRENENKEFIRRCVCVREGIGSERFVEVFEF